MAKKEGTNGSLALQGFEQSTLRILLAAREQANAQAQAMAGAASTNVRNYLLALLTSRGLDPQKWGVSPDMTNFVEVPPPTTGEPGVAPVPGQSVVAQTTPAPIAPPPTARIPAARAAEPVTS
jgi:hypothetical protein